MFIAPVLPVPVPFPLDVPLPAPVPVPVPVPPVAPLPVVPVVPVPVVLLLDEAEMIGPEPGFWLNWVVEKPTLVPVELVEVPPVVVPVVVPVTPTLTSPSCASRLSGLTSGAPIKAVLGFDALPNRASVVA